MARLKALLATYKWQLLAVLAALVGVAALVLRVFVLRSGPEHTPGLSPGASALPEPPVALKQKVEQAHEDALQARAEAKATADVDKLHLAEIGGIQDGAQRRAELAKMLRGL